jgi:serine/threonine-protein kinase
MESVKRRRTLGRAAGASIIPVLMLALAVGVVACGGDSEQPPSPSPTAALATVPDLSTDHLVKTEAESEIEGAGLVPEVQPTFTADVPAGQVAGQSPEAGQEVDRGSEVVIWVSLGPKMSEIPMLVGEKGDTVGRLLKSLDLVGKKVSGASMKYPKGVCYKQQPGPKDQVPMGSTVVYYVSSGLPTVEVPDVVGKSTSAAESALNRAKLTLAGTTEAHSATVPKGHVISQSVPAGTDVVVETKIELSISEGPSQVILTVPDVAGEYLNTVLPQLQMDGFQNVVVDKVQSDDPKGIIVGQLPRAGSSMTPNEQLVLKVSEGPLFEE